MNAAVPQSGHPVFHLIQESGISPASPLQPLEIPAGVWVWDPRAGGIAPLPGDRRPGAGLLLEPVACDGKRRLLVLDTGNRRLWVNDMRVAGVALLKPADQIRVDCDPACEVALYRKVVSVPPTGDQIGVQCSVCLHAIAAGARVYVCGCGNPFHLETAEAAPGLAPRKCALSISICPRCQEPVRDAPGYLTAPAFLAR